MNQFPYGRGKGRGWVKNSFTSIVNRLSPITYQYLCVVWSLWSIQVIKIDDFSRIKVGNIRCARGSWHLWPKFCWHCKNLYFVVSVSLMAVWLQIYTDKLQRRKRSIRRFWWGVMLHTVNQLSQQTQLSWQVKIIKPGKK